MKKQNYSYKMLNSTRLIVNFAIIIVIVISILDITGWMFNFAFLKSINSEWTPMKVITALCFIFSGLAMIFVQICSQTRLWKFLLKVIAVTISIVGLLTIAAYINVLITGIDFPFVNFSFFNLFLATDTRMALVTASLFFIIGIVLFLLSNDKRVNANIAHAFILPVLFVSYIVVASYILKVQSIHNIRNISVALNSGIAFLIFSLAVLFIRSDTWLMKVFTSENAGGIMARKILPLLMILPVIIGWFRIYGEQLSLYESELGVLLVAITYAICFLFLMWFTAKSVNRIDYRNKQILNLAAEEWQITFDSISDAVSIVDTDFRLVKVNKSFEKAVGLTNEELIGKKCFEIVHNAECQLIGCPHAKTMVSGNNASIEIFEPNLGIYIEASTSPIINKAGEVIGSVHITKDISKRKQAENRLRENEQKLKYHFENSPLAVVEWDHNFIVINWTTAAERIFGWKAEEAIGKRIDSIPMIYDEDISIVDNTMERLASGKENIVISSNRNYTKSGEIINCTWYNSILFDEKGKMSSVMSLIEDVTELKLAEEKLNDARLKADIATGIAEEARIKAEFATIKAEDAMKAKQQFLTTMSHEIRTPMNSIIGFTKVLLKTDLSAKQKEYLSAIKLGGDTLMVIINDILDLAKVDSGKMIFEQTPFKIESSIVSILHLFETKIQEKNLEMVNEFDYNIPEVLVGDPVRLQQIILNLVSNAIKFTDEGKITVSVHLIREDEKEATVEFAVTDTGIGIQEKDIENIFENFQQASTNTARLYGGTGLGLAIVKQLVERQGGKLSVKSKINEGSAFSFILTFQKTKGKVGIETEKMELNTEIMNLKVLVVEDVTLNQLLIKTILYDFGFELDIADNGKIAIEKLQANSYDIILMDLHMPVMNGFEATDYIRNIMNSKIPIIALTADVTTVDLEKCKAVGINDYISKPLDEKLLYHKIVGLTKSL